MRYSSEVEDWGAVISECQVCGTPSWIVEREQRSGLTKAHIVPRSKRTCNEIWNLLLACPRCHIDNQHGMNAPGWPTLTFPMLLGVKRSSGDDWRPHDLGRLYRPKALWLPAIEELPERYLEERRRHRPYELPMSIHPHNGYLTTEAEKEIAQAKQDAFWMPGYQVSFLADAQGPGGVFQVRDGLKVIASDVNELAAVLKAIAWSKANA